MKDEHEIKIFLREVLELSLPMCRNPDEEISSRSVRINKLAYEKLLEIEKSKENIRRT